MSKLSTFTRQLGTVGAAGVAVLTLSAPLPATADPGLSPGAGVDIGQARDEVPPLTPAQRRRLLEEIDGPGATYVDPAVGTKATTTKVVTVDDDSLELVQVVLGAIGGAAAVAGAAVAMSGRHRRRPAHPA
jgi:hypothetical protein